LVVDPIISLIEDQVEGLLQYGIDRAAPVTSSLSTPEERSRLLKRIERGEYLFIFHSPERLQSPAFRNTLRALAETSLINLAVIDEAHCVSEWGHDFRPAYLNVGRNIRHLAKDRNGHPPPLIALTGTASRAVLKDVLTELDVDRSNSEAVIRPESFDRKELKFHISRSRVQDADAALRGALNALPAKFGLPKEEFFRSAGRRTASGIIFVPFVNGNSHGVVSALDEVRSSTRANVTFYAGKAPRGLEGDWEVRKRVNVRSFKSNAAPILVATKAFGMGIDKPNIRYTVHLGMPGSLEAFYQEAGRAGRDRAPAHCTVVYSEFDPNRSDKLLDPALDLDEVQRRYKEVAARRRTDDDVTRALWFHLNAFSGADQEMASVKKSLAELGTIESTNMVELPFWNGSDSKKQEKALYRLVKIGVINDYEVVYGSRLYRIYLAPFNLQYCKKSLLKYVEAAQPGRVTGFARELDKITPTKSKDNAIELAQLLISFTYDVIERSRRRALQEAILLAREANDDRQIRRRLLEYLQEGIGAEAFEELLDKIDVQLSSWRKIIDKADTPVDAGQIRGLAIRFLESFPDHPGLLLIRAVSEMMCSDANEVVAAQALHATFKSSAENYALEESDWRETLSWLAETFSSRKAVGLALPFAIAFYKALDEGLIVQPLQAYGKMLLESLDDDRVKAVNHTFRVSTIARELEVLTDIVRDTFESKDIFRLVGHIS
jgi:ATP-dependent DNA helicase RecQ